MVAKEFLVAKQDDLLRDKLKKILGIDVKLKVPKPTSGIPIGGGEMPTSSDNQFEYYDIKALKEDEENMYDKYDYNSNDQLLAISIFKKDLIELDDNLPTSNLKSKDISVLADSGTPFSIIDETTGGFNEEIIYLELKRSRW